MSNIFEADDGATPLTPEEMQELIPTHITLRGELNEIEQQGILSAEQWAFSHKRKNILDEYFLQALHKRMFGEVWKWAGKYRKTERNIGVAPRQIEIELRKLLDDARYWIENETYPPDEIAVRFHHRLVWVHPFPNGNGRHARLVADLLIVSLGGTRFGWGQSDIGSVSEVRKRYIAALRAADKHEIDLLLAFARS